MIPTPRQAWRDWSWAALNCPHRSHLRRYRWPILAIGAIRCAPALIRSRRRRP